MFYHSERFIKRVCGTGKGAVCLFILAALNILLTCNISFADNSYLDHLLLTAENNQLHNERYWNILLHYKKTISGTKSLIDDPRFFLAPDGSTNPRAELLETLKGFFREQNNTGNDHPRCRFIARFSWLKEKLNIDESHLPGVNCEEYRDAVSKISPKSAVLVFPAGLMNMPASMFGHTLIRVDNKFQSKLLSYAVNYSAITGDTGGVLYIFKGLFGYYKGFFSIQPFYEKIKEYNDIDQRDLWEYNLNLSEEELQKMLMHLWEMKDIYSYYYFFDENCSYNILFLFEAARPSLNLTDHLGPWVIPLDTVRAVKKSGLVDSVDYRPSKATTINHIASLINTDNHHVVTELIESVIEPEKLTGTLPVEEKIKTFDLAAEMIQYKYFKKELSKEEYLTRFLSVLNARSRLGKAENESYKISLPSPPESGHPSSRLGLSGGIKKRKTFYEIKIRPAYHDRLDPDDGYIEGSQIVFTDINLRYYPHNKRFQLERFDIIDVVSISPSTEFFKPRSWKIGTGIKQKMHRDSADHMVYYASGGYGVSSKNNAGVVYYVFAESDLNIGKRLDQKYSLGIGASTGLLKSVNDIWKVNVSIGAMHYMAGDRHDTYRVELNQGFKINSTNGITINLSRTKTYGVYIGEAKLNWNLYF